MRLRLSALRVLLHGSEKRFLPRGVQALPELRRALRVLLLSESDVLEKFSRHARQSVSQGGEESVGGEILKTMILILICLLIVELSVRWYLVDYVNVNEINTV